MACQPEATASPINAVIPASSRITVGVPKGAANTAIIKPAKGWARLLSKVITPTVLPKSCTGITRWRVLRRYTLNILSKPITSR